VPRPDARRPLKPTTEHVVGVDETTLGSIFGLSGVRIWVWANYESCSFHDALQLLFKDLSH
jgi:hypothetical protein